MKSKTKQKKKASKGKAKKSEDKMFKRDKEEVARKAKLFSIKGSYARNPAKKLNKDTIAIIEDELSKGHHPKFVAAAAGLTYGQLLSWIRKGRDEIDRLASLEKNGEKIKQRDYTLYSELYVRIQYALYQAQDTALSVINIATKEGDWRAGAHFLERRFPEIWGKKIESRVETNQPSSINVQTILMVPKTAESVEDWNKRVKARKEGKADMIPTLPGSSQLELPKENKKREDFDELLS